MLADGRFACRKPNILELNPPPGNTQRIYQNLTNDLSLLSLKRLAQVGIIDPIEYDEIIDYMVPLKIRLPYFYPRRHLP